MGLPQDRQLENWNSKPELPTSDLTSFWQFQNSGPVAQTVGPEQAWVISPAKSWREARGPKAPWEADGDKNTPFSETTGSSGP
jgi:hypothetical protein